MTTILLGTACAGSPPASEQPPQSAEAAPTAPGSLLPDGIWEAELSAEDLSAAGASADAGVYQWTFDGTRARITVDDDRAKCDGDAEPAGDAVRISWHPATGCGGYDIIEWTIEADALHLSLVATNGDEAATKAILEAKAYRPVEGDSTLKWSDGWTTCEQPNGGACLGTLTKGTYTSDAFTPGLMYTVPDGWQNVSDREGELVLFAPGQAADAAHAEYIAVFTSVRAENRACSTESEATSDEPGVARTPEAMAAEFQERPGLSATDPQPVTIGGLSGIVMDISMAPGWTGTCFYSDAPVVQLIGGAPPSDFSHGIETGLTMRLYLLAHAGAVLAIEVTDYADGDHLDSYSEIAEHFEFAEAVSSR